MFFFNYVIICIELSSREIRKILRFDTHKNGLNAGFSFESLTN